MSDEVKAGALSRIPASDLAVDTSRIPRPLTGFSFLNRAQYRAYEKELDGYLKVIRKRNEIGQALADGAAVSVLFQQQLARVERLDDIRHTEHLKVDAELDAELDKATQRAMSRKLMLIKQRTDIADATANAILAEQRLEALQNPPAPAPEPQTVPGPSASERRSARLAQLRRDEAELISEIKNGCTNDEDLPEAERELIERVKLKTADLIADLIESFT